MQVATNILVTMNLVGMGLGVTLIPGYMNNFNTGQVVFRPIVGDVPTIALLMAWKKGELKPALQHFYRTGSAPADVVSHYFTRTVMVAVPLNFPGAGVPPSILIGQASRLITPCRKDRY